jgi:hypothetical protein
MLERNHSWGVALSLVVSGAVALAACGNNGTGTSSSQNGGAAGAGAGGSTGGATGTGASSSGGAAGQGGNIFDTGGGGMGTGTGGQGQVLDVQPSALQTITVVAGQNKPTVTYSATLDGKPVNAGWGLDKGNVGTIPPGPSDMATFTPSGTAGGTVTIQAGLNKTVVQRQIMVKLTASQNGADPKNPLEQPQLAADVPSLTAGGGIGGVGGEGLGGPVDMATANVLSMPSGDGSAQGLQLLYPYDKTVWPRGLLAPLLMWRSTLGGADAIQIHLETTTGSFSYTGTFSKPDILSKTGQPFVRHPIPQDIWDMATNSAGGSDQLTVSLTIAKGGKAYGPISETWTIAPGRLTGTIYYNSYGTQLAKNYGGAVGGDGQFGAAMLSIHVGDTGPKLVAGSNSACRTCHSVAAFGSRLVATDYGPYYDYDLSPNGAVEKQMPNSGAWFPGIYPDGSMMLTGDGQLLPLPNGGGAIPSSGLSTNAPDMPAFSADGKLVAFNPGVSQQLKVMSFDLATKTFSADTLVVDDKGTGLTPGWPAFFPDGKSVVLEQETQPSALDGHGNGILWTRENSKGFIAWASASGGGGATPLDQLNGKGYLPKLAAPKPMSCYGDSSYQEGNLDADHGDDANLNYEPTVNPVASGGYAWVVFTSRRMYGSVAAIPPFCSDPRGVDLVKNITPKKLWVAAIDLDAQPGKDASHPAFYLPAQELLAGNSRGFWVLDPCKPDGSACSTGDQCCGGYCEPMNGALVCANIPPNGMCSKPMEKCSTDGDCCDPNNVCINGFCSEKGPF